MFMALMQGSPNQEEQPWSCTHPDGNEDTLKRPCAPPFGYEIIEKGTPKKLEFPQESHFGEEKCQGPWFQPKGVPEYLLERVLTHS